MEDKDLNKNAEILWNKKEDIDMLLTSLFSSIQNPDFVTFNDIKPTEHIADAVRTKIESVCEDIVSMIIKLAERNKGSKSSECKHCTLSDVGAASVLNGDKQVIMDIDENHNILVNISGEQTSERCFNCGKKIIN